MTAIKPGYVPARADISVGDRSGGGADLKLAAEPAAPAQAPVEEITVIAKRLEQARLSIEPQSVPRPTRCRTRRSSSSPAARTIR